MDVKEQLFDIQRIAKEYGVSETVLDALEKQARVEFGSDEMMVELHVVRAIRRIRFEEKDQAAEA